MIATLHAVASPYPGLRAFEQAEAEIFFGRGQQVADMLVRLEDHRFLAVVGASGCGKSSLVKAGLVPALEQGYLASAAVGDPWRMAVMRPGNAPLRNLARELVRVLLPETPPAEQPLQAAMVLAALRTGPNGLAQVVENARLPEQTHVLIVVDQFEELFRFARQASLSAKDIDPELLAQGEEAAMLVTLLLATAEQAAQSIHVIITMRSDFTGYCDIFHGLPEAISKGQFLTPRLTRDQARDAIVEPALLRGGAVEEALVNRILNEIGNLPDQLPLMQHVLMRLWDQAEADAGAKPAAGPIVLRLAQYQAIGELAGALDRHGE